MSQLLINGWPQKKRLVCWDPFGNLIFKQHLYVPDLCPGGSPIARWPFVAAKDSPSDKLWSELGSFNFDRSLARKNINQFSGISVAKNVDL